MNNTRFAIIVAFISLILGILSILFSLGIFNKDGYNEKNTNINEGQYKISYESNEYIKEIPIDSMLNILPNDSILFIKPSYDTN